VEADIGRIEKVAGNSEKWYTGTWHQGGEFEIQKDIL